jgi:hypothetical protein
MLKASFIAWKKKTSSLDQLKTTFSLLSPMLLARYLLIIYVYLHSTLALRLAVEDDQAWGQDQGYVSMVIDDLDQPVPICSVSARRLAWLPLCQSASR